MNRAIALASARALVRRALCVRAGEQVVIIADDATSSLAEILADAVGEAEAEPVIVVMKRRSRHAEEPPASVAAALASAQAALMPTTFSLTHTRARVNATERGVRIVSLPGANEVMFTSGALDVDYVAVAGRAAELTSLLRSARVATLKAGATAELIMPIGNRKVTPNPGVCSEPGTFATPPCLEVNVSPHEDLTEGTVWVDGAIVPGGPVSEPFSVNFHRGRLQLPLRGRDGARLETLLSAYEDENVSRVVELGIGLNPHARIGRGVLAEDEGEFGTVHLGLGEGRTFGSKISASTHIDLVMRRVELWLDDRCILRQGEFLV